MNPQPTQDPLKFDELLVRCMGETEFAYKIVRDFLDSSEPILEKISSNIAQSSVLDAAKQVHRLKGTAATVAAKPFLDSLLELEELLRADKLPINKEIAEKFATSCKRFDEVKRFAETHLLG